MLLEIWIVSFVASCVSALDSGFVLVFSLVHVGRQRFIQTSERIQPNYINIRANAAKMERLTQISKSMEPK